MAEERVERRLAAILAADVAGYSRLMGVDEEGTLAALKRHRREARIIGYAIADRTKSVYLPQQRLIGTGKRFRPE